MSDIIEHLSENYETRETRTGLTRDLVDRKDADDNHPHTFAAHEQRSSPRPAAYQRAGAGAVVWPGGAGTPTAPQLVAA